MPSSISFFVSRSMWKASSSCSSLLDAVGPEQRAQRAVSSRGGSWRHASFMTRPMAFDIRSHSRASTASCRRPDGGEAVILGAAAELRHLPLGLDPALVLEAMQGGVERALVDLQHVLGDLPGCARRSPSRAGRPSAACAGSAGRACRAADRGFASWCRLVDTIESWCRLSTPSRWRPPSEAPAALGPRRHRQCLYPSSRSASWLAMNAAVASGGVSRESTFPIR